MRLVIGLSAAPPPARDMTAACAVWQDDPGAAFADIQAAERAEQDTQGQIRERLPLLPPLVLSGHAASLTPY